MKLSPITKDQWISVVKNSLLAGLAAFFVALQASGTLDKKAYLAAATAAGMAVFKVVEKAFSQQ